MEYGICGVSGKVRINSKNIKKKQYFGSFRFCPLSIRAKKLKINKNNQFLLLYVFDHKLSKDNITYAERSKIKCNLIRDNIGRKKKR